jgi:glycosyltransferase involved in cell wall biosynthesis
MKIPLVSVIIPTYNSADFIEEALESLFEQTFQDFEIIVIDDGSTDETAAILEKYGDRIVYLYQDNGGCASARNKGIRIARGKYIAFLDADDIWLPAKLEKQVLLFNKRESLGMVTTGSCSFDKKGIYGYSTRKREFLMHGNIARNIFLRSGVGTPTVMVRKEVFDNIGLFEERTKQGEKVFLSHGSDDNMWIRIASHYDIELIDEVLTRVRNHPRRMTVNQVELQESVRYNIRLLKTKYGDKVKMKIEKAVPIKMSYVQFAIGYGYYESGNYRDARKAFIKGSYHWIWFWKNPLFLMLTFIPPGLTGYLKALKRKIAPIPTEGVARRR